MKPHDFLDTADELAAGTKESDWRSAVSRAYYASFHVASQLLDQCGFIVPDAESAHAYLWLRLSNTGHPDLAGAGGTLNDLRKKRNRADYDLHEYVSQREAYQAMYAAAELVKLLDAAAALPTLLAQITAAIRDYERDVLRTVTWKP
jgi:uncharacterized protein (UPF0332 family)